MTAAIAVAAASPARIMTILLLLTLSWVVVPSQASSNFFYDFEGSSVVEHGYDGIDFRNSRARKVVEFYDPHCGACQRFKDDFIAISKLVRTHEPDVEVYGVSCKAYKNLCNQNKIRSFPKMVVFPSGDYDAKNGVGLERATIGPNSLVVKRLMKELRKSASEVDAAESSAPIEVENDAAETSAPIEVENDAAESSAPSEIEFATVESSAPIEIEVVNERELENDSGDEATGAGKTAEVSFVDNEKRRIVVDRGDSDKKESNDSADDNNDAATGTETEDDESEERGTDKDRKPNKGLPVIKMDEFKETDAYKNTMKAMLAEEKIDFQDKVKKGKEIRTEKIEDDKLKTDVGFKIGGSPETGVLLKRPNGLELRPQPKPEGASTQQTIRKPKKPKPEDASTQQTYRKPPPPKTDKLPVGGDEKSPNRFASNAEQQKQFQEFVAKHREKHLRNQKLKHPVKTLLGKTQEAEEISMQKKMEESPTHNYLQKKKEDSPMKNYKSQYKKPEPPKNKPDLRPEAQKKGIREKVFSKVPIVKRVYKRSKGEETLNDAALSFTRGLLMGVYRKSNEPLDFKRKTALVDWLDLLSVSLPPEIGLHELIDELKNNIDAISQSPKALSRIIAKHPIPDPEWSESCAIKKRSSSGFFCGFWKLLHVTSLGFAEQAGGLALQDSHPEIRVFSTEEAGSVLREYMAFFFNCEKCTTQFLSQYDQCAFNRCHRFSDETEGASALSWREFPLWIWEVHNDVSRSKANRVSNLMSEKGRKDDARKWASDMQAVYPHIDQCVTCITPDGTWNKNAIYNYLEKEYWALGYVEDSKVDQFMQYKDVNSGATSSGFGPYFTMAVILVLAWVAKKRKLALTGRHKKDESLSLDSFPRQNGASKYRDA